MHPAELNRLCQSAGVEGSLWRLIRAWDPDKVGQWLAFERRYHALDPMDAMNCVAEVMAGSAMAFAQHIGGDRRDAILGSAGLIRRVEASARHKLEKVGGPHIIRP